MTEHRLPDYLVMDLKIIFVGTAAGRTSAQRGHYYAGPGNRFWNTLHEIGLTPRKFRPEDDRNLLALGIGLTDISKLGCGMDHHIDPHQFDPTHFEANLKRFRPRAVGFNGKKAASIWLGRNGKRLPYGRVANLEQTLPAVFVLPSTSGAARRHWDIGPWREMAQWI